MILGMNGASNTSNGLAFDLHAAARRVRSPRVAVIGAGMSGVCMGVKLVAAGIDSFTIYEKAGDVGGTWRDHTYPGLHCDIPSPYYAYTFAPNPGWTHAYPERREIQAYVQRVAEEAGVRRHIRFDSEVTRCVWDAGRWKLTLADGSEDTCDVLVAATGLLHYPVLPRVDGLETFAGDALHTSDWNEDVAVAGRRVGVIGNGSSGAQLVGAIAGDVEHLAVFQRTPQWMLPVPNWRNPRLLRAALERVPRLNALNYRASQLLFEQLAGRAVAEPGLTRTLLGLASRAYLRLAVRDPDLRRRLTPQDKPFCKRMVQSCDFYPALQRPNVDLVTDRIERITPAGVATADGTLHRLDMLVFATGYDAHAYMRRIDIVGAGGRRLADLWQRGVRAYRSVALPGFPNLFMLLGPNSPFAASSLTLVAETQADYALKWIEQIAAGNMSAVAPTEEATDAFAESLRQAMPRTPFMAGCSSWFLNDDGYPDMMWPWMATRHRQLLSRLEPSDFAIETYAPHAPAAAS